MVVRTLDEAGAYVILTGRDPGKLEEARRLLINDSKIYPFDLLDVQAIQGFIAGIVAECGPLDGLAHCAGMPMTLPIKLIKMPKAEEIMKVNWETSFALAQAFRMRGNFRKEDSRIVFVSSTAAIVGETAMSVYSASKGAVQSMTRALASEFAQENIRVNAVCPGFIRTAINDKYFSMLSEDQKKTLGSRYPLGFGLTEDVAYAVAFLMGPGGRWITGVNLPVDGGLTAI